LQVQEHLAIAFNVIASNAVVQHFSGKQRVANQITVYHTIGRGTVGRIKQTVHPNFLIPTITPVGPDS